MADIHLERLGGFGNFGGEGSAIRSTGEVSSQTLSPEDQERMHSLFSDRNESQPAGAADMFRYRITWDMAAGARTIEVPETLVPATLRKAVRDRLP